MKRRIITALLVLTCMTAAVAASVFGVYADDEQFALTISVSSPEDLSEGERVNVVISVGNIAPSEGLLGLSFTLDYDKKALTPVVVAANPDQTTVYDEFIVKSPTYIMTAGDKDLEVPAYENISRCYTDEGKYTLMYIDMMSYPGQKTGTTVDPTLKKDGDLVLSIPFTIKDKTYYMQSGGLVKAYDIFGTTAGENMHTVYGKASVTVSGLPQTSEEAASSEPGEETTVSQSEETQGTEPVEETTMSQSEETQGTEPGEQTTASQPEETQGTEPAEDVSEPVSSDKTKTGEPGDDTSNMPVLLMVIAAAALVITVLIVVFVNKKGNKNEKK